MPHNRIEIGPWTFTDDSIQAGNCYIGNSLPGDELSIDTLTATVETADRDIIHCAYGTPAAYYHDGALIGKFYLSRVSRVGKRRYELTCVSGVGLLDKLMHYGGLYHGEKLPAVLSDIVGGAAPYTLCAELENTVVYGWLPIATRRQNLHQFLFAEGAALKKEADGALRVDVLKNDAHAPIPDDRLALGGSVAYQTPVSGVEVTEHAYASTAADELATLYEGTVAADELVTPKGAKMVGALVTFDAPVHDLAVTGASLLESGVNYAVLSQSGSCRLTGKKYTHITKVIQRLLDKVEGQADNIMRVEEATLVSMANSENVAQRVLGYYSSARNITTGLVVGAERPGDAVTFTDPFDEKVEGFIQSMDIQFGALLKAAAVLVAGYVPSGSGNFYTRHTVLRTSGMWTVPEGVTRIRVVLISGGQGGSSGESGQGGTAPTKVSETVSQGRVDAYPAGISGRGGQPGPGGQGGKIYEFTINTRAGIQYAVGIGAGGAGGSAGHLRGGSAGGATTFGDRSSDSGAVSPAGYTNLFTGDVYALSGVKNGRAGGRGSGALTDGGDGVAGPAVSGYQPGADAELVEDYKIPYVAVGFGGYGGGAAMGSNGGAGYRGSASVKSGEVAATGGRGGYGATPSIVPAAATTPGNGGNGGHGGGGGGGSGMASCQYRSTSGSARLNPALPYTASGGSGGQGGSGAPGCIIVYY